MGSTNGYLGTCLHKPLFSFGIISDVQYADIPDGRSFLGVPRYYRHSFQVLQRAVHDWNKCHKLKSLDFSINFGDIVDGFCPKHESEFAIQKVVNAFQNFHGPVYHMLGNHCLYNLSRTNLVQLLNIPSVDDRAYYDFSPSPEYRIVVLDGFDISAIGWPLDHPKSIEAMELLKKKNPNNDKNSPEGMVGLERRFLMFNGACGKEQLHWLHGVLEDSTSLKQKVILCCHLPLDPGAACPESLLWNYDEVMELIHNYKCVKVCLAGHDHKGGYSVDANGIHHRVLEAALECPPGSDSYGHVDVYLDMIILRGKDRMSSTEMIFSNR